MITFIFRKRSPNVFSIESIFDGLYDYFEQTGVAVCRLELPHVSTGVGSVLRNAWFVFRQRKTRLLHITGDVHYAAMFCLRSRTVVTIHDCVVLQRGTGFKRLVMWLLWFGLPLRLASAITVISGQTRTEILDIVSVPEQKITCIPNFVDPTITCSERRFDSALPRILHIGTTPNKNLSRVVAALQGIPCVLVIVGPLSPQIVTELRSSGIRHENHVGVDKPALLELYRDSDVVSFPSTYEGFGMPIVEGQAIGRPVLTSDLEPMRSVSGPGGALLVDPHSVDAIRDGFLALTNDAALRARLVAAGLDNCRRFTLGSVAAAYAALYRRIDPP
jgi:glycosyltransferase involved in cell wall biosynthesis